jgi:PncC family amidohydrolase
MRKLQMENAMRKTLEILAGNALRERGWTLALGESCTGGLLSHRITNVPGSSEYFQGGIVAYAYPAKENLLGVRHSTLATYGAVSRQTALEMANGARTAFLTDVGLSVTGIAGPGGAQPDKPVGFAWIAVTTVDVEIAENHTFQGNRLENKSESVDAALRLLLRVLGVNA